MFYLGGKKLGKIVSIANQKGGVGKTTTSINLSTVLAKRGKKVLLMDADPQGNATSGLGINKEQQFSVYDVLIEDIEVENTLQSTIVKHLDLCPSNINLAGAEVQLVSMEEREYRLKKKIDNIKDKYDFIIIDCPPSLGLVTLNAFTASDSVLIPIQCEYYALEGLGQLLNTIDLVKKHMNKSLQVEGALLTNFLHAILCYLESFLVVLYIERFSPNRLNLRLQLLYYSFYHLHFFICYFIILHLLYICQRKLSFAYKSSRRNVPCYFVRVILLLFVPLR